MEATAHVRHAVRYDPSIRRIKCGSYSRTFVTLGDADRASIANARVSLSPAVNAVHMDAVWHLELIYDIFTSEIVFSMSNNISYYVNDSLLPFLVHILPAPVRRDRTSLQEVLNYISSFSHSGRLLKHVLVVELQHVREANLLSVRPMFVLTGSLPVRQLNLEYFLEQWERHANGKATTLSDVAVRIIDEAYIELFYALRGEKVRFSVSADSDHNCCITTLELKEPSYVPMMRKRAKRMDENGCIEPSMVEYVTIIASVAISLGVAVTSLLLNWAHRENWLERLFDSVGVFSLVSAVTVALASRKLDVYDLVYLLFGQKRYLSGYLEMLALLRVKDHELKVALTFPEVVVAPLARSSTCFAYKPHNGVFDSVLGLGSQEEDANAIVGSKAAVVRTAEGRMRHYRVDKRGWWHHLESYVDAQFRIVVPADEIFVKG